MCGLAGLLHFDDRPVRRETVAAMTEALAHRGPDGAGLFVQGPVGLGHRRLGIIDPTPAAHQPMATADGRFTLVYNGAVYNFRELRGELTDQGCRFRSTGDTEVVLQALAVWGIEALARFNGMFALALWDARDRRLWLARDRYGIKPLYVHHGDRHVTFASEVKGLLAHPDLATEVDPEALVEYLTFQNFFSDRTLFGGVRLLPAGHWLRIEADGRCRRQEWWDFHFHEPETPRAETDLIAEGQDLFAGAVRRQLVADVPIGAYLSGGMDSGSIATIAAAERPPLTTFTVGFDTSSASGLELAFDERPQAERLSYLIGSEHYEMVLKAGDMERIMGQLVWHLEEPRVGQSYPNFYAARLASRFGKVVLAGTGSDELFGGYPWRYYRGIGKNSFSDYIDAYYAYWQRLVPPDTLPDLLAPIWPQVRHVDTRAIFAGVYHHHADRLTRPEDYIKHSLYLEAKTFLAGLLTVEDKVSMAHGLETRVPFLDNDLVDFACSLPVGTVLRNLGAVARLDENALGDKPEGFFQRTNDGKLLLRKMMAGLLPETTTNAVKQGFSAPDATWFKGESIDYVRNTLTSRQARIHDFLDYDVTQRLINEHLRGQHNRRLLIWSLLYLETWLTRFMAPHPEASRS